MRSILRRLLPASMRRSRFIQKWRFAPVILAYGLARLTTKVEPGSVLMLSDSRSALSGNLAFLAEALAAEGQSRRLQTHLRPAVSTNRSLAELRTLPREIARAEVIVLDDYYPLLYSLTLRPETKVVQVWHAAGAYKRVGFSRAGLPGGPIPGSNVHRGYTDAIVSAEAIRGDYAEAFAMPIADVHPLGVPRTDAFFDADAVARTRATLRQRLGADDGKRVVLFAPTFRGHGQQSAFYDFSLVDWGALADALRDDCVLWVKMHPFVKDRLPLVGVDPFYVDVSAEREITDLLMAADVVVTDYSSVIFEFALLDRPIVMFVPDLAEYVRDRSFYYPFEDYVFGPVADDTAGLITAIRDGVVDEERRAAFLARFMAACDGASSRRVVRELLTPKGRS